MKANVKKFGINWKGKTDLTVIPSILNVTDIIDLNKYFLPQEIGDLLTSFANDPFEQFTKKIRPYLNNKLIQQNFPLTVLIHTADPTQSSPNIHLNQTVEKLIFLQTAGIDVSLFLLIDPRNCFVRLNFEDRQRLVAAGANPNFTLKNGDTVLSTELINPDNFNFIDRMSYWLEQGVNPSHATIMGTVLHVAIANESFDDKKPFAHPLRLINLLTSYDFNWNATDAQNKTVLILAAKMRAYLVVEHLCKLHQAGIIDIDLAAQDEHGLTAAHYACILGDNRSLTALKAAGAPLKDTSWRFTLADSATASSDDIEGILRSVSIDPMRDSKAIHNNFIGTDHNRIIIKNYPGLPKEVFVEAYKISIDLAWPIIRRQIAEKSYDDERLRQYELDFHRRQIAGIDGKGLTGYSLVDTCIRSQAAILKILKNTTPKRPIQLSS